MEPEIAMMMRAADQPASRAAAGAHRNGTAPTARGRIRVDGKGLARDGRRLIVRGVTYGPFAPDADNQTFPRPEQVRDDFRRLHAAGLNALRTYHVPPDWLFHLADEQGLMVLAGLPWIDVPCRRHFGFLESAAIRRETRLFVQRAARLGRNHPSLLAYCIGNEIPPDILRWHGACHVERFLAELRDVARQTDPDGLATYASYPPTEYLDLSFVDFVTFNVYLHDREAFRRYLFRLQNLVGDKPLVLGELGMDTLRHGEVDQARFLAGHVAEAELMGLAGAFVFSWTDDWHTGGQQIEDWAFGITHADRVPKASYQALRELFTTPTFRLLPRTPRVSVVVCSYNGGSTLEQCLRSLEALDYPDYEVIVVDDGSTDETRDILTRFPEVHTIHQPNQGLSVARNIGLQAATGAVVAYTDSDCFADPGWLTHLVYQLERSGAAAVGGPNLTPEDGRLAACVAAAPGQPTHVLESDQVAEHIPGCNMAFRRDALLAINGFDPLYSKAGDDVDVCWRLQQAGHWITFAPGAFVWHHRRQNPRTYLRQQIGYGEAEALLRFKHPEKFNARGNGKWRGVLYGASAWGLRLTDSFIYRGTFGTGFFQCLYRPGPAHWAMLPGTLEWHVAAAIAALGAVFWPPLWLAVAVLLLLSLAVAGLQAVQAPLTRGHECFSSRLLIGGLCYLQPLVRSWARYRTRFFGYRRPEADPGVRATCGDRLPLRGRSTVGYWTEAGRERTEFLDRVVAYLNEHRWGRTLDSGWADWDLEVCCHPWTVVQVSTAQEDYGGGKRLIRVRYRLRPNGHLKALGAAAVVVGLAAALFQLWPLALAAGGLLLGCAGLWWRGTCRAAQVIAVCDAQAPGLGLVRCPPSWWEEGKVADAERGRTRTVT